MAPAREDVYFRLIPRDLSFRVRRVVCLVLWDGSVYERIISLHCGVQYTVQLPLRVRSIRIISAPLYGVSISLRFEESLAGFKMSGGIFGGSRLE